MKILNNKILSTTSDSSSSSKVQREGKREVTRQYTQYGEEPHSEADKVVRMKWNWNEMESMINARQASHTLCLPYYWFSDRAMRSAKCIPHYRLGGLIRFRLSELTTWASQMAKTPIQKGER